ncbi:hypothetical protein [Polyangium spumosum]|uniref:Uncharacterized protein n=1 Tax=Polyangium spumosum TaxID=889282 RepID=A0A6N7PU98_9BACT|nr:hypothetical protein [Polyangium spumosum]MRG95628.1 hypothetical protein [Polyangium spumosum]
MTTLPNYPTPDELSFGRAESTRARGGKEEPTLANPEVVLARAEGVFTHSIHQSRLVSAVCFFVAAALAVFGLSTSFMMVFLAFAVLVALASPPLALREFRLEIERAARSQGLPVAAARHVAAEKTAAFRAKRARGELLEGEADLG